VSTFSYITVSWCNRLAVIRRLYTLQDSSWIRCCKVCSLEITSWNM